MPAILWKSIKPGKFNDKALKAALEKAAEQAADGMLLDFHLTVSKWEHQPDFDTEVSVGPNSVDILAGTDNRIYGYVSGGTRDHFVPKTGRATMAFRPGYKAKTMPKGACE